MNSFSRVFLCGMIAGTAFAAVAVEPLIKTVTAADFGEAKAGLKNGDGTVILSTRGTVYSRQIVPVDVSKNYQVSGQFRLLPGSAGPGKIYFGLIPCDAKNAFINSNQVLSIPETETVLTDPAKADDLSIKVKDASSWKTDGQTNAVFNVNADFSDLPNRNVSSLIEKIEKHNSCWEIVFKSRLGRDLPAGTTVRQHSYGRGAIYAAADGQPVTGEWKTFTGKISGLAKSGTPADQWWAGTKNARIIVVNASKNIAIEFKDLQLTPVD